MSHLIGSLIERCGETVTLQTRSLDKTSRDAETGWPVISYTESSIIMYIEPMSTRIVDTEGGPVEERRFRGYTVTSINQYDRIVRSAITFEVEFQPQPYKDGSTIHYYQVVLLQVT